MDGSGAVYLTGTTYGGLRVTAAAYQMTCACTPVAELGFEVPISDASLAKFDPTGSKLIYATYIGVSNAGGNSLAVAADGSIYLASPTGVYRFDAAGSSRLAAIGPVVNA